MGTKLNPGQFDCYRNALPDEPMFILLARDPLFYEFVSKWAHRRSNAIYCGDRPETDLDMVTEAFHCAKVGQKWRKDNNGIWRKVNTNG